MKAKHRAKFRAPPAANEPAFTDPRATREPTLLTGKHAAMVKTRADYESDVPRCQTCRHFRSARILLVEGLAKPYPDRCKLHRVACEPAGLCATWENRAGERLET